MWDWAVITAMRLSHAQKKGEPMVQRNKIITRRIINEPAPFDLPPIPGFYQTNIQRRCVLLLCSLHWPIHAFYPDNSNQLFL